MPPILRSLLLCFMAATFYAHASPNTYISNTPSGSDRWCLSSHGTRRPYGTAPAVISGLDFCDQLNGQEIDQFYWKFGVSVGSEGINHADSYSRFADEFLRTVVETMRRRVKGRLAASGDSSCNLDKCLQRVKSILCSGVSVGVTRTYQLAFPSHGLRQCILQNTFDILYNACGETACTCPGSRCCFIGDSTEQQSSNCSSGTVQLDKHFFQRIPLLACAATSVTEINAKIEECHRQFRPNIDDCIETMQICRECTGNLNVDSSKGEVLRKICSRDYGVNENRQPDSEIEILSDGRQISDQVSSGVRNQSITDGLAVCPTQGICISVPKPFVQMKRFQYGTEALVPFSDQPFAPPIGAEQLGQASVCSGQDDPLCTGCTNMKASNFDFAATFNDGSCQIVWAPGLFELVGTFRTQVHVAILAIIFSATQGIVWTAVCCCLPLFCCQNACWRCMARQRGQSSEPTIWDRTENRARETGRSKHAGLFEVPPDVANSVQLAYKEQRRHFPPETPRQRHVVSNPDDVDCLLAAPIFDTPRIHAMSPQWHQSIAFSNRQIYNRAIESEADDRSLDELTD